MAHSYTRLYCHVVFATKNRQPWIAPDIGQRLYDYMGGIIKGENGDLLAAGGTDDHVHLLLSLHPQTSVSDALRLIKTNSSKWIHGTFPDKTKFAWQAGYGAFSVSRSNLESVTRYIANQAEHHKRLSFQDEFIDFLKRHEIEFDPRYIWE
ncbi:MAG: IS200/IS605 family transposase [Planctomycetes bacterium]|nr:IS200/IS605 family transposase [Planctomycetota bacterium]